MKFKHKQNMKMTPMAWMAVLCIAVTGYFLYSSIAGGKDSVYVSVFYVIGMSAEIAIIIVELSRSSRGVETKKGGIDVPLPFCLFFFFRIAAPIVNLICQKGNIAISNTYFAMIMIAFGILVITTYEAIRYIKLGNIFSERVSIGVMVLFVFICIIAVVVFFI